MFQAIISPILRSTRLCLQLVASSTDDAAYWWPDKAPTMLPAGDQWSPAGNIVGALYHKL